MHVLHMWTAENACILRFGRRNYADGSHIFHKGVDEVLCRQANDGCKSILRT